MFTFHKDSNIYIWDGARLQGGCQFEKTSNCYNYGPLRTEQDDRAATRSNAPDSTPRSPAPQGPAAGPYVGRHLALGWWSVFVFGALGLTLETLHGLKVGAYLDVANDTRRLMWTLAHAHGTLVGLVHIAFAASLPSLPHLSARHRRLVSQALVATTLLLPGGFFLGGVRFYSGDPGMGIALVPVGAVMLLFAAFRMARAVR